MAVSAGPGGESVGRSTRLGRAPVERDAAGGGGLAGTPWSVRLGRASEGRSAVEVYDAGALVDVVVATRLDPQFLRGARRSPRRDRPYALAWGRLPADPPALTVLFSPRRGAAYAADVIEVGGFCWLAVAPGRFDTVTVTRYDTHCGRLRIRKGHR